MEEINLEISRNIKYYREAADLTQEEFAELLGINRRMVVGWESGKATPSMTTLIKIAQLLKISSDDLVFGSIYRGDYPNAEAEDDTIDTKTNADEVLDLLNWAGEIDQECFEKISEAIRGSVIRNGLPELSDQADNKTKNSKTYAEQIMILLNLAGEIDLQCANTMLLAIWESSIRMGRTKKPEEPISFPLFYIEEDIRYYENKNRCKTLRRLMKKNGYTIHDIEERMNAIDYSYADHMCTAYYFGILHGNKVPTDQLYNRLYSIVSKPKD